MKDIRDVTALILAGGLGTRLSSIVSDCSKVLAEVRSRPFITYLLEQLNSSGIRTVILCTGYKGEQIKEILGESYNNIQIFYSQETLPLGTGGALRLALPLVQSNDVIVMNGDSFCEIDLKAFYNWHYSKKSQASILLTHMEDTTRYGTINTDDNERIISFKEKKLSESSGWINAGIYIFSKSLLLSIPEYRSVSIEHEIFPLWINNSLYGYKSYKKFIDIGTPESYLEAEKFFNI